MKMMKMVDVNQSKVSQEKKGKMIAKRHLGEGDQSQTTKKKHHFSSTPRLWCVEAMKKETRGRPQMKEMIEMKEKKMLKQDPKQIRASKVMKMKEMMKKMMREGQKEEEKEEERKMWRREEERKEEGDGECLQTGQREGLQMDLGKIED